MRVLFDTYKYAMQRPGGGEEIIFQLKKHLESFGVEVKLFDKWTDKVRDFDIVHYFSSLEWQSFDSLKLFGSKLVLTPTCWPDYGSKEKMRMNVTKWIKQKMRKYPISIDLSEALGHFDLVLPTTQLECDLIKKNIRSDLNFKVLYNGVRNFDLTKVKKNIDDYYIYIGSIRSNKNLDIIMEAVSSLGKKMIILGEPSAGDEEYYEHCRSINGDFDFVGFVNNDSENYVNYLANAKALINASDFETFSLVGVEAGMLKVPVVMTECGATREVYGDMVGYVEPRSVESIVEALNKISSDNVEKFHNYCNENYTWESIAQELLSSYKELLGVD